MCPQLDNADMVHIIKGKNTNENFTLFADNKMERQDILLESCSLSDSHRDAIDMTLYINKDGF